MGVSCLYHDISIKQSLQKAQGYRHCYITYSIKYWKKDKTTLNDKLQVTYHMCVCVALCERVHARVCM